MDDSDVEALLDEALGLFERAGTGFEAGLDVGDSTLLQLRKACRLIDAAAFLNERDGYYTVVVEASFAAIERSIQFYLLDAGLLHEDEYVDHADVYRMGENAGLYDGTFADKLTALWRNNRSDTYYREGIATAERAAKMLELAAAVHAHVLQLAGESHECICDTDRAPALFGTATRESDPRQHADDRKSRAPAIDYPRRKCRARRPVESFLYTDL